MAVIVQEILTVRFSKLVRNDEDDVSQIINEDMVKEIDRAMNELYGVNDGVIIEVEKNESL